MINKEYIINKYDNDQAQVLEQKFDNTCRLWYVQGHDMQYVELCDGSIITQSEDNEKEPIFPYDQYDYRDYAKDLNSDLKYIKRLEALVDWIE